MGGQGVGSIVATLRDGREVTLRPISPADSDRLVRFHSTLSERSIYQRYFAPHPRLTEAEAHHYTNVDHQTREAVIAMHGQDLVAVGRWELVEPEAAEVAFLITDDFQRLGLGSVLFALLAQLARTKGISEFLAEVLPSNRAMLRLFEVFGEVVVKESAEGAVTLRVTLPELAAGTLEATE